MYTVTVTKQEADVDGTVLVDVTIVASESTEEPALFVVQKVSNATETSTFTNSEFVRVASPGDVATYDTTIVYPGLYRSAVIKVAIPTPTKEVVFLTNLMEDIEIATGLTLNAPYNETQEESFTYTDTGAVDGPFLFAQV